MSEQLETAPSQAPDPTTADQTTQTPPAETPVEGAVDDSPLLGGPKADEPVEETPFDLETLTLPEGLELPDEQKTALAEIAGKYKISQQGVSALMEMHATALAAVSDRVNQEAQTQWTDTVLAWKAETVKQYPNKAALDAVLGRCEGVIDEYAPPEFRDALLATGMANHPAMIKFLAKMADVVGEGTPVNPAGTPKEPSSPLVSMYPSMTAKE